jgi:hypothetical protein
MYMAHVKHDHALVAFMKMTANELAFTVAWKAVA